MSFRRNQPAQVPAPAAPASAQVDQPADGVTLAERAGWRLRALELAHVYRRENTGPDDAIRVAEKFYAWATETVPAEKADAPDAQA